MLKKPETKVMLEDAKYYGYFDALAALIGLIGAIGVLAASGFGKVVGTAGAILGLFGCLWAMVIMDDAGDMVTQVFFLAVYGVAIWGALSLKSEPAYRSA